MENIVLTFPFLVAQKPQLINSLIDPKRLAAKTFYSLIFIVSFVCLVPFVGLSCFMVPCIPSFFTMKTGLHLFFFYFPLSKPSSA